MSGWYGPYEATEAIREFLTTSSGAVLSYNDELAAYNTARSLTLPDVVAFDAPRILGSDGNEIGVRCGVEWMSAGPEEGANSRVRTHSLMLAFWVPAALFDGDADAAFDAALHYCNVAQGMWARASVPGAYGSTLNNGGTVATRRVLKSEITSMEMGVEAMSNEYNYMPAMTVTVRLIGTFPGT